MLLLPQLQRQAPLPSVPYPAPAAPHLCCSCRPRTVLHWPHRKGHSAWRSLQQAQRQETQQKGVGVWSWGRRRPKPNRCGGVQCNCTQPAACRHPVCCACRSMRLVAQRLVASLRVLCCARGRFGAGAATAAIRPRGASSRWLAGHLLACMQAECSDVHTLAATPRPDRCPSLLGAAPPFCRRARSS